MQDFKLFQFYQMKAHLCHFAQIIWISIYIQVMSDAYKLTA